MNIDKNHIIATLSVAVGETFEAIAFSELEEVMEVNEFKLNDEEYTFCHLDILDPFKAVIGLQVPNAYLEEILETTIDPDVEVDMQRMQTDLAAEILNTLAGSFMSKVLPDSQEFSIGLPEQDIKVKDGIIKLSSEDVGLKLNIEFQQVHCYLQYV